MFFFLKKILEKKYLLNIICAIFLTHLNANEIEERQYNIVGCKFYKNEKIPDRTLARAAGLKKGDLIDELKLKEFVGKVKDVYQSRGFFFVDVDGKMVPDSSGGAELVFDIFEGNQVIVEKVTITGNYKGDIKKLKEIISVKESTLFNKEYFEEKKVVQDILKIEDYYKDNNLGACQVRSVKNFSPDGEKIRVTYQINEFPEKLKDDNENLAASSQTLYQPDDYQGASQSVINKLMRELKEKEDIETLYEELLSQEKTQRENLQKDLETLKLFSTGLERDLNKERSKNAELIMKYDQLKNREKELVSEKEILERRLDNMNGLIGSKLRDMEKLRDDLSRILSETRKEIAKELDRVELAQISVGDPVPAPVSSTPEVDSSLESLQRPLLQGKVLVVNSALDFIVINIGENRKVEKGTRFEIVRNGKRIGICRIIEVRKNISAADIQYKEKAVEVGDNLVEMSK